MRMDIFLKQNIDFILNMIFSLFYKKYILLIILVKFTVSRYLISEFDE